MKGEHYFLPLDKRGGIFSLHLLLLNCLQLKVNFVSRRPILGDIFRFPVVFFILYYIELLEGQVFGAHFSALAQVLSFNECVDIVIREKHILNYN